MDFNPRSPHGERHFDALRSSKQITISTHAPRTGSDISRRSREPKGFHFNPRSPHGERLPIFLHLALANKYFNPRSPHGERRPCSRFSCPVHAISTHAPRTGSDTRSASISISQHLFQPTLPARGAT